jgi:hypothetical protein
LGSQKINTSSRGGGALLWASSLPPPAAAARIASHWLTPSSFHPLDALPTALEADGLYTGPLSPPELTNARMVGSQSLTCIRDEKFTGFVSGKSDLLWISAVPRTPPSHSVCLPPRNGQFDVPVPVQYDIFGHLVPGPWSLGPPLSVVTMVTNLLSIPRAASALLTLPIPSSAALIMPPNVIRFSV